jgi:hypothetical protein
LQFNLAPVAVSAHALEQAALLQLIDDTSHGAAVVAILRADLLWIDGDAVPQPRQDDVLDEGEPALFEHRFHHIQHQRMRALDQVADAVLGPVGRQLIMLLGHLMPRQLLLDQLLL